MSEKPIRVRFDRATTKWFKTHPLYTTTVMQCEDCGLFYKPSLGHQCVTIRKGQKREKENQKAEPEQQE